jgi:hypothetical protein
MDANSHPRIALSWTPGGKRKSERPKETWRRTTEKERKEFGFESWTEAVRSAQNRSKWRGLVSSSILHEERRN